MTGNSRLTAATFVDDDPSDPNDETPRGLSLPDRYEDLRVLGSGGFGEVRRVFDRKLDRAVALKILHPEVGATAKLRARFLAEIKLTAGLQHPGIVAVHDYGELDDGRLWFTMSEIRGRTFRAVIDEAHAQGADPSARPPARRLLDMILRICDAVAYAHSRGVIHRDLKPDNVMIGEFGQVMVMDWGIARRTGEKADFEESRAPAARDDVALTQIGDVLGTPAYMPPEQAMGEVHRHGPATDVHALGAMLFHVLAGRPPRPFLGLHGRDAVLAALEEGPSAPPELARVCARAMSREPEERHADAAELAAEISVFLDGARRREHALAELEKAMHKSRDLDALRKEAEALRAEAKKLLVMVRPFDPIESKLEGWALEDRAAERERDVALREAEWIRAVHEALAVDPALPEAHAALSDHYRDKLVDAELGRRRAEAARFEVLLRSHDRGKHAAFLRGDGALTLVTDPPRAEAELHRYVLRGRRLVPELVRHFDALPLRAVELPRGSYLLRIRAPGRAPILYPVLIERGEHWDGRAPGEAEPFPIVLPHEDELGPEDVYVAAGPCWTGGDPEATDSLPRRRVWIDAFILRKYPVTCREHLAFLNDPGSRAHLGAVEHLSDHPAFFCDENGRFFLRDQEGGPFWHPDCPVSAHWHEASAHARWLAERTGEPWRLPSELEREKATRGVDGRFCPWGDHLDPAFACVVEGHRGEPLRERVTGHPTDESPYGIRGLAGNSRDWCINVWRRDGPLVEDGRARLDPAAPDDPDFRVIKGGAWGSAQHLSQAAARFGSPSGARKNFVGFRLARSYARR